MADLSKIEHEGLRELLQGARDHLKSRQPTEAVHACVDAFNTLLTLQPKVAEATVPGRRGRRQSLVSGWPNLGANLNLQALREGGKPEIVFRRDKFAMSEAMTYYEFTVEAAIRIGDGSGSGDAGVDGSEAVDV